MVDDIRPQPRPQPQREPEHSSGEENKSTITERPREQPLVRQEVDSLSDDNQAHARTTPTPASNPKPTSKLRRFLKYKSSTKKQKITGGLVVAALLVFGGTGIYALTQYYNKSDPTEQTEPIVAKEEPAKTKEPSRLTGVEVPVNLNKRPVTSVMIENSPDARPQAGLKDAGIVFEAVAEGGITRFNALFQEAQPGYIGPVRSIRPYYVDLFLPFDASIVHAGGSSQGIEKIQKLKAKDIEHGKNAEAFKRASDRFAPHNLYTSMDALDKVNKKRGYKTSKFNGWLRKVAEPAKTPTAKSINISISGPLYDVKYAYSIKSNSYARTMGGKPHSDHKSRKQISPEVVVVLVMKYSKLGIYSNYKTIGKGQMFVFQDGKIQKGTWKKKGARGAFTFLDSQDKPLALNPGQTWVTLVSASNAVSYKP